MITTKKISAGYYQCKYKNIDFTINKVFDLPNSQIAWYFQIGNNKVHDWQGTKFIAIQAAKEYIDNEYINEEK